MLERAAGRPGLVEKCMLFLPIELPYLLYIALHCTAYHTTYLHVYAWLQDSTRKKVRCCRLVCTRSSLPWCLQPPCFFVTLSWSRQECRWRRKFSVWVCTIL